MKKKSGEKGHNLKRDLISYSTKGPSLKES